MDSAPSLTNPSSETKFKSSKSGRSSSTWSRRAKVTILGVMIAAVAVSLPTITLQDQDMQLHYRDLSIAVLASIAAGSSILAATKMNNAPKRMMFALFGLGLGFWAAAEAVWAYYVFVLNIEVPYPSIADVFYLVAYPFIGYFLYRGNKMLGEKENAGNKLIATAITITVVAFTFNIFLVQIIESSIGFSSLTTDDLTLLLLSVAYPILDGILLVPAIMILYSAIRNHRESLTWILLAASMLLTVIADTGFGYTALAGLEGLATEAIWDILYAYLYILASAAIIHEFFVSRAERTRDLADKLVAH